MTKEVLDTDILGNNRLHLVKNYEEVEKLVAQGVSLTDKNIAGRTPLDTCGNAAVAREFVKMLDENTLLKLLVEENNVFFEVNNAGVAEVYYNKIKEILLNKGKSEKEAEEQLKNMINSQNVKSLRGKTPVYLACLSHNAKLTEFYVKHGGDLFIKDKDGRTPFNVCLKKCMSEQDIEMQGKLIEMLDYPASKKATLRTQLRSIVRNQRQGTSISGMVLNDIATEIFNDGAQSREEGKERFEVAERVYKIRKNRSKS